MNSHKLTDDKLYKYVKDINTKLFASRWGIDNPCSVSEISSFLSKEINVFSSISGIIKVLKMMSQNLNDINSLSWFNIFSQIRCAYFLKTKGLNITAFEKKCGKKTVVDLEICGRILCEVKSFEPKMQGDKIGIQDVELVIKNFLNKKLMPALQKQKADLLIIDDIFSYESKKFKFLDYFLSFIEEPETDRYSIIHQIIGPYLPKTLVLSFVSSMTVNPKIKYIGKSWQNLIKRHSDSSCEFCNWGFEAFGE